MRFLSRSRLRDALLAQGRPGQLAFAAALVLFFAGVEGFDGWDTVSYLWRRADTSYGPLKAFVFGGVYLGGILGLAAVYLQSRGWIRALAYGFTVVGLTTYLGFRAVNQYGYSFHEASLVVSESIRIRSSIALPTYLSTNMRGKSRSAISTFIDWGIWKRLWISVWRSIWREMVSVSLNGRIGCRNCCLKTIFRSESLEKMSLRAQSR